LSGLLAAVLAASALAVSSCGGTDGTSSASVNDREAAAIEPLPTRNPRAKAVEPVAGESAESAALASSEAADEPKASGASVPLPKLKNRGNGPTSDAAISKAEVLKEGVALPPIEAPEEVRLIIEAGNQIARTPYLWGGGHGKWVDKGYDCSGSVSFVLASAGYLEAPLASGPLMSWGEPGAGKWVTIYAHEGHVWMEVAGIRFDTSGARETGSRWQNEMRSTAGFVARHPPGL
jgi:cell wall-associated NlpC family hydrolase